MCGYLGAVDFKRGIEPIYPLLQQGLRNIAHRGPDGSREYVHRNIFLGHNRLSIIDLSANADQPLKSANADAYLIFNGEIYNYKELKNKFTNTKFISSSDTEIVLEGYLQEGPDYFKKLRGIYSFAIYDYRNEQKIILARDPSGIKPLYLFAKNGQYIFGSEIKALLPCLREKLTINESILKSYLNLGYCSEPYTIYNEIKAAEPGSFITINKEGYFKNYFETFDFQKENTYDFRQNTANTEERIKTAVERNLIADVEVTVALSGGIDSSLIYAFANRSNSEIKGLTIKSSDKEYNEGDIAKIYSDTLNGKIEYIEAESELNLDTLNNILDGFDQPYADSSAINVYYLTKAAGKLTKVLLGGDGGDELFNGYPSMTWLTYIDRLNNNSITKSGGKAFLHIAKSISGTSRKRFVKRISDLWTDKPHELLYDWHSWFPRKTVFKSGSPFLFDPSEGVEFYKAIFEEKSPHEFKNYVVYDYFRKQMLSNYLRKTDMMSMLNGVEYRVPLLDEDLTNYALTIPFGQKSSLKVSKKILRAIHGKIYPKETSSASKKGFTIPLDTALSRDEFEVIREELLKENNFVNHYVKKEYTEFLFRALDDRTSAESDISRAGIYQRILMLYSLSRWHSVR
ncbi:MAG TPA: asparagine synthase (glutamine-hydrolyzing) [Ignavibacteria bacterium]|nr:asparagine synthase (glutamine-hydrolyzing) [Ignavibacteria bacterium]